MLLKSEKKKAYTTTTERKSFGELFWPQRKTFQAGGEYKNPIKTRENHIHHQNLSSVGPTFFCKEKFCTGAGRCMVAFFPANSVTVCAYTLRISFSSDFEFIWASVFGFGVSTAHFSPKFALKCSFELRFAPEIQNGSLSKLKNWSLNNLMSETFRYL